MIVSKAQRTDQFFIEGAILKFSEVLKNDWNKSAILTFGKLTQITEFVTERINLIQNMLCQL